MNIDVTGHQLDLTNALREHVNDKLSKLARHFDHVTKLHVVLETEKHRNKAEATLHVAGGHGDLFASATHGDMYTAIDALSQKLDRQILKHKEKLTNHHKREKATVLQSLHDAAQA